MKKKILFLVLAFVVGFSFLINNVAADGTPDLANSVTFYKSNLNADVVKDSRVSTTFYKYVYDSSKGHSGIAYCMNVGYNNPPEGSTVTKTADITDPRLLYILQHGYSAVNGRISMGDLGNYSEHQAYYITQLAVWMYKGQGNGGYAIGQFSQNNAFVQRAIQLYNASASATEQSVSPWIENAVASYELHYDAANKRYISDPMHIVGYVFDRYTITLSNAPAGTKLVKKNGQEFASGTTFEFKGNDDSIANGDYYIIVPESSVKGNINNITLSVTANTYVTRVFLYQSATPNLQPLGVLVPVNSTISSVHDYKLTYQNKSCEQTVNELKNKYPNNRTKNNSSYMNDLNNAKSKYKEINTDAGVEDPRCAAPKCDEVLAYLNRTYSNKSESNKAYKNEVDSLKGKYGINLDAGYENPKCSTPTCDEVVAYLVKKYSDRSSKNTNYVNELNKLKDKYGIYTDQGIENPSCKPAPGKPSCQELKQKLYEKYPNPGDRNKNNSSYVKDVDDIVKVGQENGWQFFTDDFANPDCVKHYKREVIIRKVIKGTETDLAGATLVLTNAAGETIATWVSDGTGKVFTDLPVGKYTVTETVAPAGYNLGKIEFEITAEQDEYSLTFKVEDSPIPVTGDINFTLIITAFILFLGFGIFGLIKTSKREDM